MDIAPLTHSSLAIQIHATAAVLAIVLGTVLMVMEKGTGSHRALGRFWVGLMAVTALSSFAITEVRMFGPYSWIHGLSLLTLVFIARGVRAIRRGRVAEHRSTMISLYVFALLLTGGFTLLPGRRMHAVLFADGGTSAGIAGAIALAFIGVLLAMRGARAQSLARRRRG
ncbi:DUF2306 domain-containing protein [Pelagibacterium montanilacus]|uniref:DUF2306 domain-containing protein n=1 Tax=Pelagibacterium montanilacus TaxID=2185280 RepID=UPI000F8EC086|nr:DUF2306 domain-containing protein [Pelagibacterium montanilacus]